MSFRGDIASRCCRMPSKYRDLRTLFHISENDARLVYKQRFNSKDAVRLNFQISGNQAFYVMDSAIYELIIKAMELDGQMPY